MNFSPPITATSSLYNGKGTSLASHRAEGPTSDFQTLLDQARTRDGAGEVGGTTLAETTEPKMSREARIKAANDAAREEFFEYMRMTPAQRMREAILREMGLSEEALESLPPEEREKVEAEIAERIRARMLLQAEEAAESTATALKTALASQTAGAVTHHPPPWPADAG